MHNDLAFDDTAQQVKSRIHGLTLADQDGNEIDVDLEEGEEIQVSFTHPAAPESQDVTYAKDSPEPMIYTKITVNETNTVLFIMVEPAEDNPEFDYYIQTRNPPNNSNYLIHGQLPRQDSGAEYTIMLDVKDLDLDLSEESGSDVYIGLDPGSKYWVVSG